MQVATWLCGVVGVKNNNDSYLEVNLGLNGL